MIIPGDDKSMMAVVLNIPNVRPQVQYCPTPQATTLSANAILAIQNNPGLTKLRIAFPSVRLPAVDELQDGIEEDEG